MSPNLSDSNSTNSRDESKVEVVGATDGTSIGNVGDRLKVDAQISSQIPTNVRAIYFIDYLRNAGSALMSVNGSVTPVNFDFTPASSETWYLEQMSIFIQDTGTMNATNFGSISALTNGIEILARSNGTEYTVSNIKNNESIAHIFNEGKLPGPSSGFIETSDAYLGTVFFRNPILLQNSTSDYARVKVRDNLGGIDRLTMVVKLWKVI